MKNFLLALAVMSIAVPSAEAGVIHRLAKIASAPVFLAGFSYGMVRDFVVIPYRAGLNYFDHAPFVKL